MAYVYHVCALYHVGVVVIRVTRVLVYAVMKALVLIGPNDEVAHAPRGLRRRRDLGLCLGNLPQDASRRGL
jgi:hypothetical protein